MAKNIFGAMREKADKMADERKKKKKEQELRKKEAALRSAKEEEERVLAEQKAINDERERLISMSYQELMAETIMAIRGFYKEFSELKERQMELEASIDQLETDISDLYESFESMENNSDDTDYSSY